MFGFRDTAAMRKAVSAKLRSADGALRPVAKIYARTASGLALFYAQEIRAAVNPENASGFSTSKTGTIFTNYVSVSAAGGTAPYSYSWSATYGIGTNNPSSAVTNFYGNPSRLSGEVGGSAICTITDALGSTASVSVEIYITRGY